VVEKEMERERAGKRGERKRKGESGRIRDGMGGREREREPKEG
jgi:hypothetical protein